MDTITENTALQSNHPGVTGEVYAYPQSLTLPAGRASGFGFDFDAASVSSFITGQVSGATAEEGSAGSLAVLITLSILISGILNLILLIP